MYINLRGPENCLKGNRQQTCQIDVNKNVDDKVLSNTIIDSVYINVNEMSIVMTQRLYIQTENPLIKEIRIMLPNVIQVLVKQ